MKGDSSARFVQTAAALGLTVTAHEPLARHTTFRIGGPADLYAAAATVAQLERLAELAAEHGLPATILGGGSNILVSDAGVCGLVIANQTRGIEWRISESRISQSASAISPVPSTIVSQRKRGGSGSGVEASAGFSRQPTQPAKASTPKDDLNVYCTQLMAESGVALAGLARTALKAGFAGLEWAVSVPGTVGGAVIGNAGAHGGDVAGNLGEAVVAYPGQGRQTLTTEQMAFAYRSSLLKQQLAAGAAQPVVLQAAFNLIPGDAIALAALAESYLARRRASQPVEPSAGSIFRNPPGDHAGRLVEAVGLKGYRIGGAQISPRHANFIVNVENARAADVRALLDLMQKRVLENTGIELVPEILFMGKWYAT